MRFANGSNLTEVVGEIARRADENWAALDGLRRYGATVECFEDYLAFAARDLAGYLREAGVTLRDVIEIAEVRTSPKFVYYKLRKVVGSMHILVSAGHYNEAGFDNDGTPLDLDGQVVFPKLKNGSEK